MIQAPAAGGEVSADAAASAELTGLVLRTEGPQPLLLMTGGDLPAEGVRVRGKAPKPMPGALAGETPLVVGDRVRVRPRKGSDEVWDIVERVERQTVLQRGEPGRPGLQAIVANVDGLVVVVALHRPEPSRYRLDRLLVLAEEAEIPAIVCLNKADLAEDDEEAAAFLDDYRRAGYQTLATSVVEGWGLPQLREVLHGRTLALVGESGAGKSSLLNALYPGVGLRVGEISAPGRGTHTTTAARLLQTPEGLIADTPGMQFLMPADVEADEVGDYFPEIYARKPDCRFPNCTHTAEADCAVLAAVATGEIGLARYESYVELRDELDIAIRRNRDLFHRTRRQAAARAVGLPGQRAPRRG